MGWQVWGPANQALSKPHGAVGVHNGPVSATFARSMMLFCGLESIETVPVLSVAILARSCHGLLVSNAAKAIPAIAINAMDTHKRFLEMFICYGIRVRF